MADWALFGHDLNESVLAAGADPGSEADGGGLASELAVAD